MTPAQTVVWEIPEPHATFDVSLDDGSVTIVRRHGNPTGPRLVISHGTGLAVDLYVPFWSAFLDDFDVFVHDLRNHGWNDRGPLANHTIPDFARDHDRILAAIEHRCGPRPTVGVYHSLAALAALAALAPSFRAAAKQAGRSPSQHYNAVILFDPPLYLRDVDDDMFFDLAALGAAKTRRKRSHFQGRADFQARVTRSARLARVVPGVHELMARTTLRERADGSGYELCCPPEYEAQVFKDTRRWARSLNFVGLGCPVKVIGSDPALPQAYSPTLDADQLATIEYESIPGTTHLLPLEAPRECVAAVLGYLGRRGLIDSAPALVPNPAQRIPTRGPPK